MPPRHIDSFLPLLRLPPPFRPLLTPLLFSRSATHISEGRANKASQGPGKRLGAKKSALELVVPGNIIFRQRGTHWYPGENCGMGRDHTIFAKEKGYVLYYKDVEKHPDRKYIGIVFERHMTLPRGRNEARRRRLGLVGRPRQIGTMAGEDLAEVVEGAATPMAATETSAKTVVTKTIPPNPTVTNWVPPTPKKGYMYRPSNWEIGRMAEKPDVKLSAFRLKLRSRRRQKRRFLLEKARKGSTMSEKKKKKEKRRM